MSAERNEWRRRPKEGYDEFPQRIRDFNRDMDVTIENYASEMDRQTNNTRHEIIDLFKNT
eukprot:6282873-Karenia_brevis.AAC.1